MPEPVNTLLFREVLLPHLQCTMNMDWFSVLPENHTRLIAGENRFSKTDSSVFAAYKTRCGSDAVDRILDAAASSERFSFSLMQDVQEKITGPGTCLFRQHPAFCNTRNERYAFFDGAEKMFAQKTAADFSDHTPSLCKAARLYLDIIFFHPFADGNARAALAWHLFFAARFQFRPVAPDILFGFPFSPGHEDNYRLFVYLHLKHQ